jgi:hypothetical protein
MPKKIITRDKNGAWSRTSTPLPAEVAQKKSASKGVASLIKPTEKAAKKTTKPVEKANKE